MVEKKELNEEELEEVTGGLNPFRLTSSSGKTFRCKNCGCNVPGSDIGNLICFSCGGTDFEEVEQ